MEQTPYEIIKYGDPVLHKPVAAIQQIDQSILDIIAHMRLTMYHAAGVGLAANQVGLPISLALVDTSVGEQETDFLVFINPTIVEAHGSETDEEGCLSVPGYSLKVPRSTSIFLRAVDYDGNPIEREYTGFMARVIQHELDHLNGKTIVDRTSPLKRRLLRREIEKLIENDEW
jgi:peptide deformylase